MLKRQADCSKGSNRAEQNLDQVEEKQEKLTEKRTEHVQRIHLVKEEKLGEMSNDTGNQLEDLGAEWDYVQSNFKFENEGTNEMIESEETRKIVHKHKAQDQLKKETWREKAFGDNIIKTIRKLMQVEDIKQPRWCSEDSQLAAHMTVALVYQILKLLQNETKSLIFENVFMNCS